MILNFTSANLVKMSLHYVGNKQNGEIIFTPDIADITLSNDLKAVLSNYFLSAFKSYDSYQFWHESEIDLNEIYNYTSSMFDNIEEFEMKSKSIAKHLYEKSTHPNTKGGELFISYFKQCIADDQSVDAICIIKSEHKDEYIKTNLTANKVEIHLDLGLSLNKVDKGCVIFNTDKSNGYKVVVIDHTSRGQEAAAYWKDEFLQLKIRNDSFNQTNNALGIYKNFVTQKLDDEFELSKADKIDLLNKSMKYFKEKDTFDMDEFTGEVIGNPQAIESFRNYKSQYEQEFESPIADVFEISSNAVKKQQRVYKSVLKLDRNFHIYIHGDKELIEKGFDEGKSMNYYKVYFKEEA